MAAIIKKETEYPEVVITNLEDLKQFISTHGNAMIAITIDSPEERRDDGK